MSDAQRQAVTELMRSSVRVAERPGPTRPEAGRSRGPVSGAKPAFISVLSSRRSGHTPCARARQDANGAHRATNDSLQPETISRDSTAGLSPRPSGVCAAPASTCGFRLLGAAYGRVSAASGRGGAANAREGLEGLQSRARGMSGTTSI